MKIVKTVHEVRDLVKSWKKNDESVGFVPTMGFLHEGHLSLIKASKEANKKTVVSIFVNPIQFGPKEDLSSYPRDLNRDAALCEALGVDLIFAPEDKEMYFDDFSTRVMVDGLTEGLCGASRPGHFQGVCTVVSKLFNIVAPDRAYFGEKDAQQLAVIKKMVEDLNFPIEIIGCPIVREADGLAKSSRNTYLNPKERAAALVLSKSLKLAENTLKGGESSSQVISSLIAKNIQAEPLASIDYISIVDSKTLKPIDSITGPVLIALAVYMGKTRLIDNFTFIP